MQGIQNPEKAELVALAECQNFSLSPLKNYCFIYPFFLHQIQLIEKKTLGDQN